MREKTPTVSVIIPTFNRAHLIGRAIKSVLNQTYQDFEIIVVDDGSTDNTQEIVKGFRDKRIRYIRHKKNTGAAAARNSGISASFGKYIGFQDSDDKWLPEKLEKQIKVMDGSLSKIGYVYSDMWHVHRTGRKQYWPSPTIVEGKIVNEHSLDYQVFQLGIVAILIKRECFEKVGIFDERFPRLIDLEFFIRLAKQFDSYHIKEPLVQFYETNGISSNEENHSIARILLLEKYYNEVKRNRKFLAKQNMLISKSLYSSGHVMAAKRYLLKALIAYPLYRHTLSYSFRIVFGEMIHAKFVKSCRRMKDTLDTLLTNV